MPATVMIVDDSPTIRGVLKAYLEELGVEFLEAEAAERALQVLRLVPVDLVISDVRMPGMDGLEFVRAIRNNARPSVRKVPVVLLTSDKSDQIRADGTAAGANRFVIKPVADTEIRQVARDLLGTKLTA